MFVKRLAGKVDQAGRAFVDGIPDAMILGSFWAIPGKSKLIDIKAEQRILYRKARQETEKRLLLEFDRKTTDGEVDMTMMYICPGIRWIPTYRIVLDKPGDAALAMQAEILNEVEDLTDVRASLVVGVPNFRFKDVISPMSLEANLRDALKQAAPQLMSQSMSNMLFTQRSGEIRGRTGERARAVESKVPTLPTELAGEEAQDLFIYHVPQLSLRAGDRAIFPLISAEIPFRHFYTWDVRLSRSGTEALSGSAGHTSPVKLLTNEIWHQIELNNNTNTPWTTGAAMVMDGYLPIAQELLTYTPIGGKCQLPLTVAMDVRGTYEEEEIERKLKAIHFDGYDYVRISKKGTLRVTNYKKESIELIIACSFGGNGTKASDEGKIMVTDFEGSDWRNFRGNTALTGHSTIRWDLKLKSGETKEVTCEYHYFTR